MTKDRIVQDVIYLAACAVNERIPDISRVEDMNLDAVYSLAKRHMISAIVAIALESAGHKDKKSRDTIASAQRNAVIYHNALMEVNRGLEMAGIWHMPLKGIVLQNLYPVYGMRQMADHDILFDAERANDVKVIMEKLGFRTKHFGISNHDVYYKEPVMNFEMHSALFSPRHDKKLYEYYRDIDKRLLGDGYEKHLSPEDFYLYVTAHEYKHYIGSGTGLRSLLDTYMYLQKEPLDIDYVAAEAEKLGMAEFEAKNRSLAQLLFSGDELKEADREMLDYIMSSGVYGTLGHRVENKMARHGYGKIGYALDQFFVPFSKKNLAYTAYAGIYPFFYKHKIFLPLLPFYRTFRAMKSGRFKAELEAIKKAKLPGRTKVK